MQPTTTPPRVSVLMPTYRQAYFIRRALGSLLAQTLRDWELVIIDDGSDDDTRHLIEPYLSDSRIRYHRLPRNGGLGNALNLATSMARGEYIAYLPSDDVYYSEHLARLVAVLEAQPNVYLAYGGVSWTPRPPYGRGNDHAMDVWKRQAPTLQGEEAVNAEREVLERVRGLPENNNLLALVQVMHRRSLEKEHRWTPREVEVSDRLEADFWWGLLSRGAVFAYAQAITSEWVIHMENRHHIIRAPSHGGLSRYRQHYQIPQGEALNWNPSRGIPIDEREAYARVRRPARAAAPGGLKILMVGELGFNPERIIALEEAGHQLYGLWSPPEIWDTASSLPFGHVENIPFDARWRERVREIQPDIIYALLNWTGVAFIDQVLRADLGIPVAFHFKESPIACLQRGLWPALMRVLSRSDGQIFISEENLEWFQLTTHGMFERDRVLLLDGDPTTQAWMTDDWAPKLSARDGQLHTVCTGRPIGLDPRESAQSAEFALSVLAAGIHVHLYGGAWFRDAPPEFLAQLEASGLIHYHPMVRMADWVRELSQYDAAWCHIFTSRNGGELRRADWPDLNLPARINTYAAAGLPWILKDNSSSCVAIDNIARRHDVGIFCKEGADLAEQLRDSQRLRQLTDNMRAARHSFSFEAHMPVLVDFFRRLIHRRKHG